MVNIGIPSEVANGETRVAMTPANVAAVTALGATIRVQQGAGNTAYYTDKQYSDAGAQLIDSRQSLFAQSDIILQVQSFGAHPDAADDLTLLHKEQTVIGMMDPLSSPTAQQSLADKGITSLAMELIPRISRAQGMDVLSSMAMIAGYKAVLMGASQSGRLLPMMMTSAGTLTPARVFIMGAGVAGLQAAATAKRLGAVVAAYDVRPAACEQILSVGAKPIELNLATDHAEDANGYAAKQGEGFIQQQRQLMSNILAEQDIIITTAAIPGATAPVLITQPMVHAMKPGTVIVDLAAERGGNCELTQLGKTIVEHDVIILGPNNVPATVPYHASQLYGKNCEHLLRLIMAKDGVWSLDFDDEIIAQTVVSYEGQVRHPRIRDLLNKQT